ncbi:DDE-type integrase/transposase/recombinase [Candidatus Woesearchaeota archaeon]|nr:DDE-type integrase/transposase/recombinase [Candidatus Woesearchaeota archaeon]
MLNAGIEPILDGSEFWIPSQNDKGKKYKVTISGSDYLCQCPDHQHGNLCKHILLLEAFLSLKKEAKRQRADVSTPCPDCSSLSLQKDGTRKTTLGKKPRWLCNDCGKRFVNEPLQKIKGNMDIAITAIDLYMKGVSYRGIADSLKQFYGLRITHVTVLNWVNNYMAMINQYVDTLQPNVSNQWHADEQFIKVKGKTEYVWNVLDNETCFLLASNQSKTRSSADARETFQKAKAIAGTKATTVVTDGRFNYSKIVKKEWLLSK